MDRHKERDMDMAGKMSGIDRHGASGQEEARNLTQCHRGASAHHRSK